MVFILRIVERKELHATSFKNTIKKTKNVLSKEVASDMGLYRKAMLCVVFCASVAAGSVEAADGVSSGVVIDRVVDISSTGVMPLPEHLDINDVREASGVNLDSFDISALRTINIRCCGYKTCWAGFRL